MPRKSVFASVLCHYMSSKNHLWHLKRRGPPDAMVDLGNLSIQGPLLISLYASNHSSTPTSQGLCCQFVHLWGIADCIFRSKAIWTPRMVRGM